MLGVGIQEFPGGAAQQTMRAKVRFDAHCVPVSVRPFRDARRLALRRACGGQPHTIAALLLRRTISALLYVERKQTNLSSEQDAQRVAHRRVGLAGLVGVFRPASDGCRVVPEIFLARRLAGG